MEQNIYENFINRRLRYSHSNNNYYSTQKSTNTSNTNTNNLDSFNSDSNKKSAERTKNIIIDIAIIGLIGAAFLAKWRISAWKDKNLEKFSSELAKRRNKIDDIVLNCVKSCDTEISPLMNGYSNKLTAIKHVPFDTSEIGNFAPKTLAEWFAKEEELFKKLDDWFKSATQNLKEKSANLYEAYEKEKAKIAESMCKKAEAAKKEIQQHTDIPITKVFKKEKAERATHFNMFVKNTLKRMDNLDKEKIAVADKFVRERAAEKLLPGDYIRSRYQIADKILRKTEDANKFLQGTDNKVNYPFKPFGKEMNLNDKKVNVERYRQRLEAKCPKYSILEHGQLKDEKKEYEQKLDKILIEAEGQLTKKLNSGKITIPEAISQLTGIAELYGDKSVDSMLSRILRKSFIFDEDLQNFHWRIRPHLPGISE